MLWSVIIGFVGIIVLSSMPSLAAKALEVRLGAAVTLQCNLSYHYEINWVRMSSEMNPELLMVLGLNKNGDFSITWNSNSSSFQGFINNRFIHLKIIQVSQTDLVTYFCAAVNDKQIKLSEGMRLYALLDEKQTPDQNLTNSQGSDTKSEDLGGHFHTHMLFSGVLSGGLLLMIFTIIAVHIMTR